MRTTCWRAAAQGQRASRDDRCPPARSAAIHRKADRAAAEFRGAGGHRDGECAAARRIARAHARPRRIARIPDRDQRRAEGHQPLDLRSATGAGYAAARPPRGCAARMVARLRSARARSIRLAAVRGISDEIFGDRERDRAGDGGCPRSPVARAHLARAASCISSISPPIRDIAGARSRPSARCGRSSACRCCAKATVIGMLTSIGSSGSSRSPSGRSSWCAPLPTRRSSRSRTRGCSTELRESLEQQQAIAEILQVINSLARRPAAGVRRDTRKGEACAMSRYGDLELYDGEQLPGGRDPRAD